MQLQHVPISVTSRRVFMPNPMHRNNKEFEADLKKPAFRMHILLALRIYSKTLKLLHFIGNRLTDGGKVVGLTRWPPFTPRKIPSTHFC
jgi:hypothetical protein